MLNISVKEELKLQQFLAEKYLHMSLFFVSVWIYKTVRKVLRHHSFVCILIPRTQTSFEIFKSSWAIVFQAFQKNFVFLWTLTSLTYESFKHKRETLIEKTTSGMSTHFRLTSKEPILNRFFRSFVFIKNYCKNRISSHFFSWIYEKYQKYHSFTKSY